VFHVYANPKNPAICCLTALAAWLTLGQGRQGNKLFSGKSSMAFATILSDLPLLESQDARYYEIQREALETPEGREILSRYGLLPSDMGVHSIRKGAASFAVSGTTAAPSFVCVARRAQWKIDGVKDRYLFILDPGDQYLGRILAGLNPNSVEFALLPPHVLGEVLTTADIKLCFVAYFEKAYLSAVLRFCLPSLVLHRDFILETLRPAARTCQLATCALFSESSLHARLSSGLNVGIESPEMAASGVPPHVQHSIEIAATRREVRELRAELREEFAPQIIGGLRTMLEEEGAAAAQITPGTIEDVMRRVVADYFPAIGVGEEPQAPIAATVEDDPPFLYFLRKECNNRMCHVPDGWDWPKVTVYEAWRLWHCGIPAQRIAPFRHFEPLDFPAKSSSRKRLSDWIWMMDTLKAQLDMDDYDAEELLGFHDKRNAFVEAAVSALPTPQRLRNTRPHEWKLVTAVKMLRPLLHRRQPPAKRRKVHEHWSDDAVSLHSLSSCDEDSSS
jgi:hypothetical protein